MTDVFVVRNQLGHYWGKAKIWVDGSNPRTVLRARYEDEAINTLFELSSKDIALRGEVLAVQLTERGDPMIEPSPFPLLAEAGDEAQEAGAETAPEVEPEAEAHP
jgi:hypothetical protein